MPIAFKEWAVTVRALAEGEQLVTLRKGGIREPEKHFALEHDRFFLYPTFDHQRGDLVRESHQPELRRALEEGVWADGEPPAHALYRDGGVAQPDRVRIRAWAEQSAATLSIEDNGPGFDPQILPRLFGRRIKGKSSTGHGLGLAFIDAVVRAHHGTITASNAESGGARIVIVLPTAQSDQRNALTTVAAV